MAISTNLIPYISVGQNKRTEFEQIITDFFDDFDTHLYIRGQAGVGKTYTVMREADQRNIVLCHFEGNVSRWAFMKKLACTLNAAGWPANDTNPKDWVNPEDLPKVVVYCDDLQTLFDPDFVDTMKIALEQEMSDKLVYGASLGAQYKQAEPFERAAIDNFRVDGEPGFKIPFYGRVKFIFTMNHALATDIDVTEAKKAKKSLKMINELEVRYAIFSRLTYQDQYMAKNEYWGWIADLVLNHNILPTATQSDKEEMLDFLHEHWENLKDKSVRMVKQKLWKDMEKAKHRPNHDYKGRWKQLIRQAA
jgi:hypothetical protein